MMSCNTKDPPKPSQPHPQDVRDHQGLPAWHTHPDKNSTNKKREKKVAASGENLDLLVVDFVKSSTVAVFGSTKRAAPLLSLSKSDLLLSL